MSSRHIPLRRHQVHRHPGRVRLPLVAALAAVGLLAAACGSSSSGQTQPGQHGNASSAKGHLTVANAGFTESEVLSQAYADLLRNAGYSVNVKTVKSSEIFTPSLRKGKVDVAPEYVATYADQLDAIVHHKKLGNVASPSLSKSYAALQKLAGKLGLTALKPTKAVDQNAFAVRKDFAKKHHLTTLSDLGKSGVPVSIAGPSECKTRSNCVPGLQKTYGITVKGLDPFPFDSTQAKKAVQSGSDDVAEVSTTDATVADFDLVILKDNKNLENADNLFPIANSKSLTPTIKKALNKLVPVLTTQDLGQLNKKVDVQRKKPADVAKQYLQSKGLLSD
jgi:osmoprotectant transport system substrate-binding protein